MSLILSIHQRRAVIGPILPPGPPPVTFSLENVVSIVSTTVTPATILADMVNSENGTDLASNGETIVYAIISDPTNEFEISAAGELSLRAGESIVDTQVYNLVVQGEAGGVTDTATVQFTGRAPVTFTITDVAVTVLASVGAGDILVDLSNTDTGDDLASSGEAINYTITTDLSGKFEITVAGEISLISGQMLTDAEVNNIIITASAGGVTDTVNVSITAEADPAWPTTAAPLATQNDLMYRITVGASNRIEVDTTNIVRANTNMGDFFGFNNPIMGQQAVNGDAFVANTGRFKPPLRTMMVANFQGSPQRVPGGLHGNGLVFARWSAVYGSRAHENWYNSTSQIRFGYQEWLQLCADLGWPTLEWMFNLTSVNPLDSGDLATPAELAANATLWANAIAADYGNLVNAHGQLSNEIDREHVSEQAWSPMSHVQLAANANAIIDAVLPILPNMRFDIFTQTHTLNYPNTGNPSMTSTQHKESLLALIPRAAGMDVFAYTHQPENNPLYETPFGAASTNLESRGYSPAWVLNGYRIQKNQFQTARPGQDALIRAVEDGARVTQFGTSGANNLVKSREMTCFATMQSLIDTRLGALAFPWVASCTMHASMGRWWLTYNGLESGQRVNTGIPVDDPLPFMHMLAMVKNSMRGDVLGINLMQSTDSTSSYLGYDARALVMHDPTTGIYTACAVNRHTVGQPMVFSIPALAGMNIEVDIRFCRAPGTDPWEINVDFIKQLDWIPQGTNPRTVTGGEISCFMLPLSVSCWQFRIV